jgi:hypothetical protein
MADIATIASEGARRIVTKVISGTRYVSCACCAAGAECCVYPAACGRGPESVVFYGNTLSGDTETFGNTTNGVILEDQIWAVYRNGVRTTRDCLGMALQESSVDVAANLASGYSLSLEFGINAYTASLNFQGGINPLFITDLSLFGQTAGQCFWDGAVDQSTPDFDQGIVLVFNPANCRWELASGPLDELFAYREDDSPIGEYTDATSVLANIFVA